MAFVTLVIVIMMSVVMVIELAQSNCGVTRKLCFSCCPFAQKWEMFASILKADYVF